MITLLMIGLIGWIVFLIHAIYERDEMIIKLKKMIRYEYCEKRDKEKELKALKKILKEVNSEKM